jgi:hypothetical protein
MIESSPFPDDEQIARLVHSTLHAATQPDNGRLKQLMPSPSARHRKRFPQAWQKQLATVCAALILCLGLFGFYQTSHKAMWPNSVPKITATFTSEPTATATSTDALADTSATSTAVVSHSTRATPAPPTPIAALPIPINSNQ